MRRQFTEPGRASSPRRGSVLLVVLGVLMVLTLIGLSFVLFARTESDTARNFLEMTNATMQVEAEIARLKSILLDDLYPDTGTGMRLSTESHDYADTDDGWLFGFSDDGTGILQASFRGAAPPDADADGDGVADSVWRPVQLSNGFIAWVATRVVDHGGLANVNIWGNTQHPTLANAHNGHEGLHPSELNLTRVLGLDAGNADERDTYARLFYGDSVLGLSARYGMGAAMRPGHSGLDDDGDSDMSLVRHDDDADGTTDEDEETYNEPDEFCFSSPNQLGVLPAGSADIDNPFDFVDALELLKPQSSFRSRLELLATETLLDTEFASGTLLGTNRNNLTTLSADPQWVGVAGAGWANHPGVRLDLNYASLAALTDAARQAGLDTDSSRQLAVNLVDYRDADDDVTAHPDDTAICGHERQPYINEVFFGAWKQPVAGAPEFRAVAVELYNPYDTSINVYQWELRVRVAPDAPGVERTATIVLSDESSGTPTTDTFVPAGGYLTIVSADPPQGGDSYVFNPAIAGKTIVLERPSPPDPPVDAYALPWPDDNAVYQVRLVRARPIGVRPDAADPAKGELIVDDTDTEIDFHALALPQFALPTHGGYVDTDVQRPDAEVNRFMPKVGAARHTLGLWNNPNDAVKPARFSVPIVNRDTYTFGSIGELGRVLDMTQNGSLPYTDDYANMVVGEKERNIKFDLTGDWYAGGADNANRRLLDLVCVKRPDHDGLDNDGDGTVDEADEADWPVYGRVNINTVSTPLLTRALNEGPYSSAEASVLASEITSRRNATDGPYTHVGDLFRSNSLAAAMSFYAADGTDNDGDGEDGEKDERDARFRYLANLVTTRSNVFTAYILVRIEDPVRHEVRASRRAVVVLDRSRAGMTVRYESGTRRAYVESPVIERAFRWLSN